MQPSGVEAGSVPAPSGRTAICWLDVLLLLCLLTIGLSLWTGSGRIIHWRHRLEIPQKEVSERASGLPLRSAELAMAQDDLKAAQAKLFEQRMEATRLDARIKARNPSRSPIKPKEADPSQEDRLALASANAIVRDLDSAMPAKLQRVMSADAGVFEARRQAETAFTKARESFELRKKFKIVAVAIVCWLILFVVMWFVCGVLHRKVGKGRKPIVLLPAALVFALVCAFEFLR